MDGRYYNLWSTDNERTDANDDKVIKSVYDPSPVGYSLPAANAFTGFTTTGGNVENWPNPLTPETKAKFNVKGDFDKGWYFYTKPNKQGNIFFFPASGSRAIESGSLANVSRLGHYSMAARTIIFYGYNLCFDPINLYPLNSSYGHGFPVRSAEEKVWRCVVESLQCADFLTSESEEEHASGAKMHPLTVVGGSGQRLCPLPIFFLKV